MGERIYTLFHAVTPSDTDPPAPFPVNGIYVLTTGTLFVLDNRGIVTQFTNTVPGTVIPIAPQRVMATGPTSGTYVALGNVRVGSF